MRQVLRILFEYLGAHATLQGAVMLWGVQVIGYLCMLPTSIFSVAAGCAFGFFPRGIVVAVVGHGLGFLAPFLLSRYLLKSWVGRFAQSRPIALAVMAAVDEQPFTLCTLLRLSPVPIPVSYLIALTSIEPATYLISSLLGLFPLITFSVYLGSLLPAISDVLNGGVAPPRGLAALGLIAGLAAVFLVTSVAKRKMEEFTAQSATEKQTQNVSAPLDAQPQANVRVLRSAKIHRSRE